MFMFCQACISLLCLPDPKAKRENRLESQMLQGGLFNRFKWSLCQLVEHQGEVPGGDTPQSFGSISVKTIQETNEIFIFADMNG